MSIIRRSMLNWDAHRVTTPPGDVLSEEFLKPRGVSQQKLAVDIGVPVTLVCDIVHGRRPIGALTALRLARYFGTTPEFWLNLQTRHDLSKARKEAGNQIEREVKMRWSDTF